MIRNHVKEIKQEKTKAILQTVNYWDFNTSYRDTFTTITKVFINV